MAENKKGVILYTDLIYTFEELSDEEAGKLIKHLFRYVNDQNPEPPDKLTKLIFQPIKLQLKRDLEKWETMKGKRSEAGKASAEAKKLAKELEQNSTKSTSVESVEQNSTKSTVNVTVNDTVTVTDNVKNTKCDIKTRKLKFSDSLKEFLPQYGSDMLNDFYAYWTEPNPSGTKFKQEMQKTWDTARRLNSWYNNDFNKEKNSAKKENRTDQILNTHEQYLATLQS